MGRRNIFVIRWIYSLLVFHDENLYTIYLDKERAVMGIKNDDTVWQFNVEEVFGVLYHIREIHTNTLTDTHADRHTDWQIHSNNCCNIIHATCNHL